MEQQSSKCVIAKKEAPVPVNIEPYKSGKRAFQMINKSYMKRTLNNSEENKAKPDVKVSVKLGRPLVNKRVKLNINDHVSEKDDLLKLFNNEPPLPNNGITHIDSFNNPIEDNYNANTNSGHNLNQATYNDNNISGLSNYDEGELNEYSTEIEKIAYDQDMNIPQYSLDEGISKVMEVNEGITKITTPLEETNEYSWNQLFAHHTTSINKSAVSSISESNKLLMNEGLLVNEDIGNECVGATVNERIDFLNETSQVKTYENNEEGLVNKEVEEPKKKSTVKLLLGKRRNKVRESNIVQVKDMKKSENDL